MMDFKFSPYVSGSGRTSIFHGIPVQYREEVLRRLKFAGIKVKLRYRGPRAHNHNRGPFTNSCSCLMRDAVTFAVYPK